MRVYRSCDVCALVDGDTRAKPVRYCSNCDAYICDRCWPNMFRRGAAMAKRKLMRLFGRFA